jgi:hypothetical protein
VNSGPKEKAKEALVITITDADADPRAVMVVYLDTGIAPAAMKGPWRPQMLAGLAIRQLCLLCEGLIDFLVCRRIVLELCLVVKNLSGVRHSELSHFGS